MENVEEEPTKSIQESAGDKSEQDEITMNGNTLGNPMSMGAGNMNFDMMQQMQQMMANGMGFNPMMGKRLDCDPTSYTTDFSQLCK